MAKQEKANPYNADKSWHKVEEKVFVDSSNLYFPDPEAETEEPHNVSSHFMMPPSRTIMHSDVMSQLCLVLAGP